MHKNGCRKEDKNDPNMGRFLCVKVAVFWWKREGKNG
jgi:hypothetical protein